MHLFHPTKGIHKYPSPESILSDFVELRLDHYVKRKAHLINVLQKRTEMCALRAKFVSMVIDGTLTIFRRKKADLECEMEQTFPKIDGSFDYLLHTRTVEYTEERVAVLMADAIQAKDDLEYMMKMSHVTMWRNDIKNINTQ
jgi:DNA topoisomerase-2